MLLLGDPGPIAVLERIQIEVIIHNGLSAQIIFGDARAGINIAYTEKEQTPTKNSESQADSQGPPRTEFRALDRSVVRG